MSEDLIEQARKVLHASCCGCGDYVIHSGYYEERIGALDAAGLLARDNSLTILALALQRIEKALEIGRNKSLSMGTRLAHINAALTGESDEVR
jgi:hypothetical protein